MDDKRIEVTIDSNESSPNGISMMNQAINKIGKLFTTEMPHFEPFDYGDISRQMAENISANIIEIPYEDTQRYVMDRQLEETQKLNDVTLKQNELLIQSNTQLSESYEIQKQQLLQVEKQNELLQIQLDTAKSEKEELISKQKKQKKWVVAGKILASIFALLTLSVAILAAWTNLYPQESKEFIDKVLYSQTLQQEESYNEQNSD